MPLDSLDYAKGMGLGGGSAVMDGSLQRRRDCSNSREMHKKRCGGVGLVIIPFVLSELLRRHACFAVLIPPPPTFQWSCRTPEKHPQASFADLDAVLLRSETRGNSDVKISCCLLTMRVGIRLLCERWKGGREGKG